VAASVAAFVAVASVAAAIGPHPALYVTTSVAASVCAAAGPHPAYVALSASVPGFAVAVATTGAGCRAVTELQLQGQFEDLPVFPDLPQQW
jgi:hypothetical protein